MVFANKKASEQEIGTLIQEHNPHYEYGINPCTSRLRFIPN